MHPCRVHPSRVHPLPHSPYCPACNCRSLQALSTQQANKLAGQRSLPLWAIAAMLFLGWNELMAVLWNPVFLIGVSVNKVWANKPVAGAAAICVAGEGGEQR